MLALSVLCPLVANLLNFALDKLYTRPWVPLYKLHVYSLSVESVSNRTKASEDIIMPQQTRALQKKIPANPKKAAQ
jgi:hypothetical protein